MNWKKPYMAMLLLCLFTYNLVAAQGTVNLQLTVRTPDGKALSNKPVDFVEMHSRQKVSLNTDQDGFIEHSFQSGRFWQINIGDIQNYLYWQFEVKPGKTYHNQQTITYDYVRYLRDTRPAVDRPSLNLSTEHQNHRAEPRSTPNHSIVKLVVKRPNKQALGNYPVQLTCYKLKKTFASKTSTSGVAWFLVPVGQDYEIDIDGIGSYKYVDLPTKPMRATRAFTYEPTLVNETSQGDTTSQQLAVGQKGTSGRVIAKITFRGGPDGIWKGEPVVLEVLGEKKWYKAITDGNGQVRFLLPKGKQYMIHGRFEKDLDVLDYRRNRGIGYSSKSVLYRPQDKYQFPEKYIPKAEDQITFAMERFLKRQYPKPEAGKALRTVGEFTGLINQNSKEAVLRLAFTTPHESDISYAPPLNLAFVLDKSGSMAGAERIGRLRESLVAFAKNLRPTDLVSLIVFDDNEQLIIPISKLNIQRFSEMVERIEAGGGTNIYKGMVLGYRQVAKSFRSGSANRVIILSDGYGVTPVDSILDAQKPFTAKGINCSTVGIGENYNYPLLKLLATQGGGHIEHVNDSDDMKKAFIRQMASVLFPVARNVKAEVIFPQGLEFNQVYGVPLKEKSGNRIQLKLKNAFAGLDQLGMIHFRLKNPSPALCEKPVTVRLTYTDAKTGKRIVEESQVKLEWQDFTGELELVREQEEKKLYAYAVLNQSMKVMADRFYMGNLKGARQAIEDARHQLRKVYPVVRDQDLKDLQARMDNYLDIITKRIEAG